MTQLEIGDIVFIAIDNPLYRRVAAGTGSWTSHVGVIVNSEPGKEVIAESTFPFSKETQLEKFKQRSKEGRYSVKRLNITLSKPEKVKIQNEAKKRLGIIYHSGFNFDSSRQYCSKFVYEIFKESLGIEVGVLETFQDLLSRQRNAPLLFWHLWFLGFIPWSRRTVTPASQYNSPLLHTVEENLPRTDNLPTG